MPALSEIDLVPASVHRSATFLEAAEVLVSHPVASIAVLDDDRRVIGLFGDGDMIGGVFPAYIGELKHTSFASEEADAIFAGRTEAVATEPVDEHMHDTPTLALSSSVVHIAERFLHCEFGALPVVDENERFVGMLGRAEFCRAVLRKWGPERRTMEPDAPRASG